MERFFIIDASLYWDYFSNFNLFLKSMGFKTFQPITLANRKAIRLEKVVGRLNEWRTAELKVEER